MQPRAERSIPVGMQMRAVAGGRAVRLVMQGELDIATSPRLHEALAELRSGEGRVILDLRAVTFVDSQGIQAILDARSRLAASGIDLAVIRGGGQLERVFALTGFDQRVECLTHPSQGQPPSSHRRAASAATIA